MLMHRTMTGLSERIPEAWDTRISSALVADGDHTRAEEFLRRTGASVQPGATVRQISTPESPKTAEICPWPATRRPKRPTRGFGSELTHNLQPRQRGHLHHWACSRMRRWPSAD